jgi:hypothetical protein
MTNYPFLNQFSCTYEYFNIEEGPVMFANKKQVKNILAKNKELLDSVNSEKTKESDLDLVSKKFGNKNNGFELKNRRNSNGGFTYVTAINSLEYSPDFSDDIKEGSGWKFLIQNQLMTESVFILKWLNKFVCRKQFNTDNFLECIFDSYGDVFVDFVEQVRGTIFHSCILSSCLLFCLFSLHLSAIKSLSFNDNSRFPNLILISTILVSSL